MVEVAEVAEPVSSVALLVDTPIPEPVSSVALLVDTPSLTSILDKEIKENVANDRRGEV
jgi:hypothetical protein